jgi:hypothetical protein
MGFNEIMQMFAHVYFCTLQINVAQKMGPKVVPKWTTFPQRKISFKKKPMAQKIGPKVLKWTTFPHGKKNTNGQ